MFPQQPAARRCVGRSALGLADRSGHHGSDQRMMTLNGMKSVVNNDSTLHSSSNYQYYQVIQFYQEQWMMMTKGYSNYPLLIHCSWWFSLFILKEKHGFHPWNHFARSVQKLKCHPPKYWLVKNGIPRMNCDYPLVNVYITMENHHAINGKTHYTWPFSIAILT